MRILTTNRRGGPRLLVEAPEVSTVLVEPQPGIGDAHDLRRPTDASPSLGDPPMAISFRASLVAFGLLLAPMAASAQQTVVVTNLPPPAPLAESPTPSPGAGFAWVAGFWNWNGSQYAWTSGHWERPPQAAQTWEAPRWEREGGRYRFRQGRWGGQGQQMQPQMQPQVQPQMHPQMHPQMMPQPQMQAPPAYPSVPMAQPAVPSMPMAQPGFPGGMMQVPMAPPRPRRERRPRMTPPGQVWVPGAWVWNNNQYAWNAGHFEAPPRPRARWIPPQVVRRGRNWQMNPGRWR